MIGIWYCAEIRKILADRIEVNYHTTITPAIINYKGASLKDKMKSIKTATFLRTWCLDKGTGLPTTTPPSTNHGKFDKITIAMAAQLDIPHHEGAGGVDDFVDKVTFQKHVRKVNNRRKRKR